METETIDLGSELILEQLTAMYQSLAPTLQPGSNLVLDAGQLTKVDAAGLQFLLCLQHKITSTGGQLAWLETSEIVEAAATLARNTPERVSNRPGTPKVPSRPVTYPLTLRSKLVPSGSTHASVVSCISARRAGRSARALPMARHPWSGITRWLGPL